MLHRFRVWLSKYLLSWILWIVPSKSKEGLAFAILSLDFLQKTGGKVPAGNWFGNVDAERLRCSRCGKSVSSPVPADTVVRAWCECPECLAEPGWERKVTKGKE